MFFNLKRKNKKVKKGSEMVETLLVFPMLIIIVFAFAYGILYYNALNSAKNMSGNILREIITMQEYCAFEYEGTEGNKTVYFDSTATGNKQKYARNRLKTLVEEKTRNNEKLNESIFFLKLKTYKYVYDEETGTASLQTEEYYDFFDYQPSKFDMNVQSHPELVGSNWVIGNHVELTVKSAVFSTLIGNQLFKQLTSVNIFGIKQVEIVSSTTTVTIGFQIENDICDDINTADEDKPETCPNY